MRTRKENQSHDRGLLCDGLRTPIGRHGGALATVRPDDLGAVPIAALMARNASVDWAEVDDVLFGCANQAGEDNRNVARMASLLAGLPESVPGATVNRLCGSGMEAVGSAARAIKAGEGAPRHRRRRREHDPRALRHGQGRECVLAPGPGPRHHARLRFVNRLMKAAHGIDSMPETAENVAEEYQVARADQDAYALRSQRRAGAAIEEGRLASEITRSRCRSARPTRWLSRATSIRAHRPRLRGWRGCRRPSAKAAP